MHDHLAETRSAEPNARGAGDDARNRARVSAGSPRRCSAIAGWVQPEVERRTGHWPTSADGPTLDDAVRWRPPTPRQPAQRDGAPTVADAPGDVSARAAAIGWGEDKAPAGDSAWTSETQGVGRADPGKMRLTSTHRSCVARWWASGVGQGDTRCHGHRSIKTHLGQQGRPQRPRRATADQGRAATRTAPPDKDERAQIEGSAVLIVRRIAALPPVARRSRTPHPRRGPQHPPHHPRQGDALAWRQFDTPASPPPNHRKWPSAETPLGQSGIARSAVTCAARSTPVRRPDALDRAVSRSSTAGRRTSGVLRVGDVPAAAVRGELPLRPVATGSQLRLGCEVSTPWGGAAHYSP